MSFVPTGNIAIDALVHASWHSGATVAAPVWLSYSFMLAPAPGSSAGEAAGFRPLTGEQQAAVRAALGHWAAVANIALDEVAADGQLQFGSNDQGGASSGYAYLPTPGAASSFAFINNRLEANAVFVPGSFGPSVLLHEIGHLLGLKHPGNYDSVGGSGVAPFLPPELDNRDYTQMSYHAPQASDGGSFPVTPMLLDIQAVQYLYGANMATGQGDTVYAFSPDSAPQCVWDAGGSNTFDFSACGDALVIDLRPGTFSETAPGLHNISIAFGVAVNQAIAGAGGAAMYANDNGNLLSGGAGADRFYGGLGDDRMHGGAGEDMAVYSDSYANYVVRRAGDGLTVSGAASGTDRLDGVECLRFADLDVSFDANGMAGQAYRLYQAAFNRAPDQAGLGFWIDKLAHGWSLQQVAQAFIDSDEFLRTYGGVDNRQFVTLLYRNALHREPEAAGLEFHVDYLSHGVARAVALMGFSESAENQVQVIGAIQNGIDYVPFG